MLPSLHGIPLVLKKILAACAALSLLTAAAATELGRPVVQDFPAKVYDGEPIHFNGVQDAAGLMYFGSSAEVHTYDGTTWGKLATEDGHFETRGLAVGPDGVVCVGAIDLIGQLRDTPEGKKFFSLKDQLPPAARKFSAILRAVSAGDTVCFATSASLILWRGGRFTVLPQPEMTRRLFAAGGRIYVQAGLLALQRLEGEKLVEVVSDPRVSGVVFIAAEPAGALLLVTQNKGLFRLEDGRLSPQPTELDGQWEKFPVLNAHVLPDRSLALALRPEGGGGVLFLRRDGRFLNRLDEANGLPRPLVYNLAGDRDDGLWLCLQAGLARVEAPTAFSIFDPTNGLRGSVEDILRHDGKLWVSTSVGLHRLVPGAAPATRARFERVVPGPVFTLLADGDGLLAGTSAGVMRIAAEGNTLVLPETYAAVALRRSARDPARLWIGTIKGLRSARRTPAGWQDEGFLPRLDGQVRSIVEAPDGTLWLGVLGTGFARVQFSAAAAGERGTPTVNLFQATHGLPRATIQPAVAEWRGQPVFSGNECGVFRFDAAAQRFTPLDEAGAIPRDPARYSPFLGARDPGHLWIEDVAKSSPPNLFQFAPGRPARALRHSIHSATGFVRCYLEEETPDGTVLWIGGTESLARVNLAQAWAAPAAFTATVRAKGISPGAQLPATGAAYDFECAAPRFQSGGALQFRTRLGGYEPAFTAWTSERKRTFTNLRPGHYRFEAVAQDADGELSTPGVLEFSVLTPWWGTWWFMGLAGATGLGTVAGVTRWLANRALRRRVALLEVQSAIERERLRLARDLHDEVGSGLGRVILFADEARRNQDDPALLAAALGRVRTTAQDLVQHAREIVWAVSPQHDTLASLVERLGDYTVDTLRAAGIACRLEVPAATDIPAVAVRSEVRHSLFLALKEAVHNCVKYSGATTAEFSLRLAHDSLEITLCDHGRGFAPGERQGSGHGLRNLAIRAEALGGEGRVTGEPGRGTTVTLRVPVSPSNLPPA